MQWSVKRISAHALCTRRHNKIGLTDMVNHRDRLPLVRELIIVVVNVLADFVLPSHVSATHECCFFYFIVVSYQAMELMKNSQFGKIIPWSGWEFHACFMNSPQFSRGDKQRLDWSCQYATLWSCDRTVRTYHRKAVSRRCRGPDWGRPYTCFEHQRFHRTRLLGIS